MKIMILVPSFGRSSPIEGAFLFAKFLYERGRDVVFVSLDNNYNSRENIMNNMVNLGIDFECLNIKGWRGLFCCKSRFHNYVKKRNIGVVIAYLLRPSIIASSLTDVVKVAYVRGMLRADYALAYGKIFSNILISMEMNALKKMDHMWCMAKSMSEWLNSEGIDSNRISIINNFVDVKSICYSVKNEQKENKVFNIGILSSLIPRKRVESAIEAIGKLIYDYNLSDVKLQIAGSGKRYNRLKHLAKKLNIEDKVVFNGFIEDPFSFINRMDLILHTSEAEGLPRCLMEALSLGKTVIAANIPCVNELILDGQTGYLFPVGDVDRLASLLDRVIREKKYLPSSQLVNYMMANYDINVCSEKMLGQIEGLYERQNSTV